MNNSNPNNSIITAVLVDGSFFLKRYNKLFKNARYHSAKTIVENLNRMVHKHVKGEYLYRVIYYDCPPLGKKVHNPITKKSIDFSKTTLYLKRMELFEELKKKRKFAIRLGHIQEFNEWVIDPVKSKLLLSKKIEVDSLSENDVRFNMVQKGVDIKIGVDIASLAYKKLVHKIILISGDCDFVAAAKLARREGIDFVLDSMRNHIAPSLFEHIDGLKSTCPPNSSARNTGYLTKDI